MTSSCLKAAQVNYSSVLLRTASCTLICTPGTTWACFKMRILVQEVWGRTEFLNFWWAPSWCRCCWMADHKHSSSVNRWFLSVVFRCAFASLGCHDNTTQTARLHSGNLCSHSSGGLQVQDQVSSRIWFLVRALSYWLVNGCFVLIWPFFWVLALFFL